MKRQQLLLRSVLFESAEWLRVDPTRSWITIQQRCENEGISFLTITMPRLHDALMISVSQGRWIPNRLWKESKGSPVFLQEFLGFIFDFGVASQPIKEDYESISALRIIRQLLLLNSKVEVLPSPARSKKAIDNFFDTEMELRDKKLSILSMANNDLFLKVSHLLFGSIFDNCQKQLEDIIPKHGPGQTAESKYGINKYRYLQDSWTLRIEKCFRAADHAYYNLHDLHDLTGGTYDYSVIHPRDELPMKIVLVPKTAKTPRIIAMEPIAKQWIQQSILSLLDQEIGKDLRLKGVVSWRDQSRNRSLALSGSRDGSLATLDLSEASDRLHVGIVSRMLRNYPLLRAAILASRSNRADFEGRQILLHKFAPMGSAMCFAMESLAFLAIVATAILSERGVTRPTSKLLSEALIGVSVYGDDLIAPTVYVNTIINHLELFGLKVNLSKSFWTGMFRESCGGDYFRAVDVSIHRLKVDPDGGMKPDRLISWICTQNQLFHAGYEVTGEWMRKQFHAPANNIPVTSGFVYISSKQGRVKVNHDLQRLEVHALVPVFRSQNVCGYDREMLFHWMITSHRRRLYGDELLSPHEKPVILAGRPQIVRLRTKFVA
jgi:hypothetical protein